MSNSLRADLHVDKRVALEYSRVLPLSIFICKEYGILEKLKKSLFSKSIEL